jgi:hypothetical protein
MKSMEMLTGPNDGSFGEKNDAPWHHYRPLGNVSPHTHTHFSRFERTTTSIVMKVKRGLRTAAM